MTISKIPQIMDRIRVATKHSPIAVFLCDGRLDSVFYNTVHAGTRDKSSLVGVYDQKMSKRGIRSELLRAVRVKEIRRVK